MADQVMEGGDGAMRRVVATAVPGIPPQVKQARMEPEGTAADGGLLAYRRASVAGVALGVA